MDNEHNHGWNAWFTFALLRDGLLLLSGVELLRRDLLRPARHRIIGRVQRTL